MLTLKGVGKYEEVGIYLKITANFNLSNHWQVQNILDKKEILRQKVFLSNFQMLLKDKFRAAVFAHIFG